MSARGRAAVAPRARWYRWGISPSAQSPDALARRDPNAVPRLTRRTEVVAAGAANLVIGLWLLVSPVVLGYAPGDPSVHDALAGAAVAVLALSRLTTGRWEPSLSWGNAVIGLWLFAAAFWLAESATAAWNEAISGALVVVLASVSAWATTAAREGDGTPRSP